MENNKEGEKMEINSYILKPGHEGVPLKTYDDFINVNDSSSLLEIEKDLDDFYLDGAIEIKYKDQIFLDINNWDLIDQLWSYILNLIEEYMQTGKSKVYFPDSPNEIKFERVIKNNMMLSITTDKKRKIVQNEEEMIRVLLRYSKKFFNDISILRDYKKDSLEEIERIEAIEENLNKCK